MRSPLGFYRFAVLFLLTVSVYLLMERAPHPETEVASPQRPRIQIIDLGKEILEIERGLSDKTDVSRVYFASPRGTIHLHLLGHGQRTPLHIHRRSGEATIIVSGDAEVSHVFGEEGGRKELITHHRADTLVHSPRLCGHEWVNPSSSRMQANLVIAKPPFDGNLYVARDDPRMTLAVAPMAIDLTDEADSATPRILGGAIEIVTIEGRETIRSNGGPTILYIAGGSGLVYGDETHEIRHRHLVLVHEPMVLEISSVNGPLNAVVFRPG